VAFWWKRYPQHNADNGKLGLICPCLVKGNQVGKRVLIVRNPKQVRILPPNLKKMLEYKMECKFDRKRDEK